MPTEPDHVARIVEQWSMERPDLDVSPMAIIGRITRLAAALDDELEPVFASFGLGPGEFDVLASLRRSGAPYELSSGELGATTMVTSGAVTKRVDRLERNGLVTRTVSADDARARRIRLTPKGYDLIEKAYVAHLENEHRLVGALSDLERTRLAHLLQTLATSLDA